MGFTTYENTANPHVTIHRDGCNQIRKNGGVHHYHNGKYEQHEPDALELCQKEKTGGRVPPEIEIILAEISEELRTKLQAARKQCSDEMS